MTRSTFVLLAALSVLAPACEGSRLTGPAAQRAFQHWAPTVLTLPDTAQVFVNNVPVAARTAAERLDPATITSVEIIKVTDSNRGVVRIWTTDSSLVAQLEHH